MSFRASGGALQKRVEYTYDLFDRMIGREVDADGDGIMETAQRFVYDDDPAKGGLSDIVLVFDESESLANRYLHGPSVDQVFADEDALGEILWHLGDHQHTTRDLVSYDAGTDTTSVVNHLEYDSFGNITAQSNGNAQPLVAWTGRFRDPDTDLQWNRARWYDPALGRWLSEDPIGFEGGDANLQRYVANSPTDYTDPTGQQAYAPNWNRYRSYAEEQRQQDQMRLNRLRAVMAEFQRIASLYAQLQCFRCMHRRVPEYARDYRPPSTLPAPFPRESYRDTLEGMEYARRRYTRVGGFGNVNVTPYPLGGGSHNFPVWPGMTIDSEAFNSSMRTAIQTFVHEANHDWTRFGFEPVDHGPDTDTDMGRYMREFDRLWDWSARHIDPVTGRSLLDDIIRNAGGR